MNVSYTGPSLESVRRERAKRHLAVYLQQAWSVVEPTTPLVFSWHLGAICEHLEAVTRAEIRNLLITVPPRMGKSTTVSVMWPTWAWLTDPSIRWIFSSYSHALSIRDSVKSRRIIEHAWYQARWGHLFRLTPDQNQKMRFENDHTGYRLATSVGGANTGEGASYIIVDDPHNVLEAYSDAIREGVLTWWDEVMPSRLNDQKTGGKVIIMQRIHERDLAGHVLEQGGYTHLNIAMEYEPTTYSFRGKVVDPRREPGELLCPERIGPTENNDLKIRLGAAAYAGQYQQRPSPAGGLLFKEWSWRYWHPWDRPMPPVMVKDEHGENLQIYPIPLPETFDEVLQSWDMAFKDENTSDFVAGGVWARKGPQKFLLDLVYGRLDFVKTCEAVLALSAKWPEAVTKLVEDKANGTAVINALSQKISGLIPVSPEGGKYARAAAISPEIESNMVFLPHPILYPWVEPFIHEHSTFPRGAHDDRVDQTTQALNRWIQGPAFSLTPEEIARILAEHPQPQALITAPRLMGGVRRGL